VAVLNLPESVPAFGIYRLSDIDPSAMVDAADTGSWLTGNGYPSVPDDESSLGQWVLHRARLYGYFDAQGRGARNPDAEKLAPHLLARGSFALRITDRALRMTVLDGKSPALGKFNAGRQVGFRPLNQARVRTLSCVWPLDDVWAIDTPKPTGTIHRLRLFGPAGAGMLIGRSVLVQSSFLKNGLPLVPHTGDLAQELIAALIAAARSSGDPQREAAADEVEAAQRESGRPLERVARFQRRPAAEGAADYPPAGGPDFGDADDPDDADDADDSGTNDHGA
jgi:hypothetical protein